MTCITPMFPIQPEFSISLGNNVFCVVNTFQKNVFVLVRVYGEGKLRYFPTRHGVAVKSNEFLNFLKMCESLRALVDSADVLKTLYLQRNFGVTLTVDYP